MTAQDVELDQGAPSVLSAERPVDEIVVGVRVRKDLGDLEELVASIRERGLLHPVVVAPTGELLAGARRLEAVKRLGWESVAVRIAVDVADLRDALAIERDENTCRKDFTPSEAVAIRERIRAFERPKAQRSSLRNLRQGPDFPTAQVGHSGDEAEEGPVGRVDDVAAEATGYGRETLRKAGQVVEGAADEDPTVAETARAGVEEMDRTGKVDPAHRSLSEARRVAKAERALDRLAEVDADLTVPSTVAPLERLSLIQERLDLCTDLDRLFPEVAELTVNPPRARALRVLAAGGAAGEAVYQSNATTTDLDRADRLTIYWQTLRWLEDVDLVEPLAGGPDATVQVTVRGRWAIRRHLPPADVAAEEDPGPPGGEAGTGSGPSDEVAKPVEPQGDGPGEDLPGDVTPAPAAGTTPHAGDELGPGESGDREAPASRDGSGTSAVAARDGSPGSTTPPVYENLSNTVRELGRHAQALARARAIDPAARDDWVREARSAIEALAGFLDTAGAPRPHLELRPTPAQAKGTAPAVHQCRQCGLLAAATSSSPSGLGPCPACSSTGWSPQPLRVGPFHPPGAPDTEEAQR